MADVRPRSVGPSRDADGLHEQRYRTPEPNTMRSSSEPREHVQLATRAATLNAPQVSDGSKAVGHGRRARPNITLFNPFDGGVADQPVPSIEVGDAHPTISARLSEPSIPSPHQLLGVEPDSRAPLQPAFARVALARSRTPTNLAAFAAAIGRPGSAFSTSSSSSCDSSPSEHIDVFSVTGSATSPETEAPTPRGSVHKRMRPAAALTYGERESLRKYERVKKVAWSRSMDQHLWACLLRYMGDPQTAPFHMRPGQAPPGGVQHFVAREAKRTWRDGRYPEMLSPNHAREGSVDTLMGNSEGAYVQQMVSKAWPSKTATRARLRELCRDQSEFTTHLQHQMKSRSPTPLSPRGRGGRFATAPIRARIAAYDTRDVRISLATSTSSTMRRNGPLAQLATHSDEYFAGLSEWFNNPAVPYASATSPPASAPADTFGGEITRDSPPAPAVQLGSPFTKTHHNTWTPGMLQQQQREAAAEAQPRLDNPFASIPRLRSPAQIARSTRQATNKRRAPFQAEDAVANGSGPSLEPAVEDDVFGLGTGTIRRVRRSRGMTLNDVFVQRNVAPALAAFGHGEASQAATLPAPQAAPAPPSLAAPFDGIYSRPTRARATRPEPTIFQIFADPEAPGTSSIDERLREAPALAPAPQPSSTADQPMSG